MSKKFNASMFDKIKDALKKSSEKTTGNFANFMKFPAGHTYTLRLIPNVDEPDKTFYHHWVNGWTSKKDGSYKSAISLRTFGESDPINEMRWKLYKQWKDSEPDTDEKFDNPIKEREQWLVNVYVVDDPSNEENNGTIKILNMGPQLKGIVDDAMTGERSDEFGLAIFDLTKDGADFKVKAEKQGVFTTYKGSYFTNKTSLKLSDDEIEDIYENVHNLEEVYTVKTYDELKDLLETHFLCDDEDYEEEAPKKKKVSQEKPKFKAKKTAKTKKKEEDLDDDPPTWDEDDDDDDDDVDELLKELDLD